MDDYLFADQQCSSGCESGWTLYLDHSSISRYNHHNAGGYYSDELKNGAFAQQRTSKRESQDDGDDEDLSMVSDASSGPPHVHDECRGGTNHRDDVDGCLVRHYAVNEVFEQRLSGNSFGNGKKNRESSRRRKARDQSSSLLDDTASSPFLDFSDKSMSETRNYQLEPSVENVPEYSQGYSTTQFEVRPPYQEQYDFFRSGNQMQHNQWFEGKTW